MGGNTGLRWSAMLAAVLFLGTAAGAASGDPAVLLKLSSDQLHAAGIKVAAATVATTPQAMGTGAGDLRLVGRAIARGDSNGVILTTVSGQIEAVLVQIGAAVRAGQPLARIGSPELAALQSEYLQARSASDLAASRLVRDEALFADGIIAESRLRETRSARQVALAAEHEQRNKLNRAGYSDAAIRAIGSAPITSSVTLHAPADATVLEQNVAVGQHVEQGTELFRLSGTQGLWLELHAPARSAVRAHVGDIVSVAGCHDSGRVIAVGSLLDPVSQSVLVRAEIRDNPAGCVRVNQYVEADVRPASAPPGLVSIPASAVVRNGDRDYVFAEQGGGFTPVHVGIERRIGDVVWLRSGVASGTRVAMAGTTALKGAWLGFGPALEASIEKK